MKYLCLFYVEMEMQLKLGWSHVQWMMDFLIKEHGNYVKKAYMAVTIFTSMRSQDCHTLRWGSKSI